MDLGCAPEHFSEPSRRYADRVVLVVLPRCAKIASVEDLHTLAISHVTKAMGTPPLTSAMEGRWTLLGWADTDSTNSRAMSALRTSPRGALDHFALYVNHQKAGRGQQQRMWHATPQDLAMTLILEQNLPSSSPFALNFAISLAVIQAIEDVLPNIQSKDLLIKWPNDIMLKGAKAGGILIENSWRGSTWSSAVMGIGLNLSGVHPYPNAAQLTPDGPLSADTVLDLRKAILKRTDERLAELAYPPSLLQQYHQRLFGWGQKQRWQLDGQEVRGTLESIDIEGRLCVNSNGTQQCFSPGEVGWLGLDPS